MAVPEGPAPGGPDPVEVIGAAWLGDDGSAVYDPTVIHEVSFTLDPADWDVLRMQEQTYYELMGPGCLEGPFASPYTWFTAEMSFDGDTPRAVSVRKKGLIGSNSSDRPSLRVDTDDEGGDRLHGLEKLVFNNNLQDESQMRTCLAHQWFADAGLVAPRCSLARVTVNGEELGFYSNTEAIEEELVERVLGAAPTTLYEGALSDFREDWERSFEPETRASGGADIAAVTEALEADDDALLASLDAVIDLDAFFTFWAAELIAGHWDGYNGNANNFYVYGAPEDGRLRFIASGPDAAFPATSRGGVPTVSALAHRLIQHEEGRSRFDAELRRLTTDVWDADALTTQIRTWSSLIQRDLTTSQRADVRTLSTQVASRAEYILATIGETVDVEPLRGSPCWTDVGSVDVDFSTTYGSYPSGDLYGGGEAMASYVIRGETWPTVADGVSAGGYGHQVMWMTMSEVSPDTWLIPSVTFDAADLVDGGVVVIDGHAAEGTLQVASPATGGSFETAGHLQGTLRFETAGSGEGDAIVGVLSATLLGTEEDGR